MATVLWDILEPLTPKTDSTLGLPLRVRSVTDGAEMVLVPPGGFFMGISPEQIERFISNFPQYADLNSQEVVFEALGRYCGSSRIVYLDAYYVDVYPVTNARYKQFVDATGHRIPQTYVTLAEGKLIRKQGGETTNQELPPWLKLALWDPQSRRFPSGREEYPVTLVNWFDACAYCEWAKKQLPTEAEWEKAARGTDGRLWPWGNNWDPNRCNCSEGGVGDLTSVGLYAAGISPYGCYDMAGNAVEWCANRMGKDRVVRGGGIHGIAPHQLCAWRGSESPDSEGPGFRCVYRISKRSLTLTQT